MDTLCVEDNCKNLWIHYEKRTNGNVATGNICGDTEKWTNRNVDNWKLSMKRDT